MTMNVDPYSEKFRQCNNGSRTTINSSFLHHRPARRRRRSSMGLVALASAFGSFVPCITMALRSPQRNPSYRSTNTRRRMVLTTPEAIFEQTSTTTLLDDLIDESTRTSARKPLMMQFDPSSGWIWKRWKGTVFSETWDSCVYRMLFASAVYLVCNRHMPQLKDALAGFNTLWAQVLTITTFTLTFFVNQSYALWRKCSDLSRRLQGRLHDINMSLAAHAARKQPANPNEPSTYTAGSRQVLELVGRYGRVFNLLTYASFTRSHRPILTPRGMRRLVERGLLTPTEREILIEAEIPATQRHNAVLLWIIRAFIEGKEAGHLIGDAGWEQQFIEKCHVCRASYGAIGDALQGRMPFAYAHIVQVLVDVVLWMYPFMGFASGMSGILIVLGTGLLTIGYQGLFDLAKQFLDPYDNENYGKGEDPLVVDTLIAETNAGSVRWLHGLNLMPVSAHKFKNAELSDVLLPLRGYSVEELKQMEKEKLQLKIKREQEELERQRQVAYEEIVRNAAQAMVPAQFDFDTSSTNVEANASYVMTYDDAVGRIDVPGDVVPSSFHTVEYIALTAPYSQNVNSTSLQQELIPVGTAPASAFVEDTIIDVEPDEAKEDLVEETEPPKRTLFGALDGEDDNDKDDDVFYDLEEWATETDYVHQFDAFDPYLDIPSYDEVGPDGQEIRLSQLLADEVWEEEIEHAREKENARSLAELQERETALEDANAKELLETEEVLSASADSRLRSERLDGADSGVPLKYYDQTQLDGISQLFGLPPDELSEIPGYEEPTIPDANFASIEQLWGYEGLSTPLEKMSIPDQPSFDDTPSFDGIAELWGQKLTDETEELLSSSATRRVRAVDEDGFRRKESRLSEMLADEVYDTEESLADHPITYEDYERQVQEILEAERAELLETQAIMNARPAAEDVVLPPRDDDRGIDVILEAERAELLESRAIMNALPGAEDMALPPRDGDRGNDMILEAERAELLESRAIMNAPPAAEDIALPPRDGDRGNDGHAYDELAILEMDEDLEQEDASDGGKMSSSTCEKGSFHDDTEGATSALSEISIEDLSGEGTWVDEPNGSGVHGVEFKNDEN